MGIAVRWVQEDPDRGACMDVTARSRSRALAEGGTADHGMGAVLVVGDEPSLREEIVCTLSGAGFYVRSVSGVHDLSPLMTTAWWPDVLVVDVLLPRQESLALRRTLESMFTVPVVLVSRAAGGGEFGEGADDDLVQRASCEMVVEGVRRVLRRQARKHEVLRVAGATLLTGCQRLFDGNREIFLSCDETALLACLLENANRAVRRSDLLAALPGFNQNADPRVVDIHLVRLMVKLGDSGPTQIRHAAPADGYVLVTDRRSSSPPL